MSLLEAQLTVLFVLLIGTFACGTLPILFFRWVNCFSVSSGNGSRVTSFLIFFGGGVLLATSLLHLLPEAREQVNRRGFPHQASEKSHLLNSTDVENSQSDNKNGSHRHHHHHSHEHSFAFPEFVSLCGFFLTYLLEEIIRAIIKRRNNGGTCAESTRFCSCAQRNTECSKTYKDLKIEKSDLLTADHLKRKRSSTWGGQDNREKRESSRNATFSNPPPVSHPNLMRSSILLQPKYGAVATGETTGLPMRVDGGITLLNRPVAAILPPVTVPDIVITPASTDVVSYQKVSIVSLLTVAALSFHSLFEGIAMGFQSTVTSTWTLFFAVAMHKFVIAFVIGTEAVVEKNNLPFVFSCMIVFSLMSPLGMGISISLGSGNIDTGPIVSQYAVGIINCLATGTLLYVTFLEILKRKCHNLCGFQKLSAIIAGFLLMSGLQYATSEF